MRRSGVRFTIGNLMIAIAVVAVLLALPAVVAAIAMALSLPWLCWIGARWLISRQHQCLAAMSFWSLATLINVVVAWACIAPNPRSYGLVFLVVVVIAIPMTVTLGRAWVLLLTSEEEVPASCREAAAFSVFLAAVLPILTLWTLWPLHVAFLVARPRMERLADQVAAGKPIRFPRRVGLFRIAAPVTQPVSGYPGLLIRKDPYTSPGFVRVQPGTTRTTHGPIVGVNFDVYLGGGWWYRG